jgi:hypothetical protein
VASHVAVDEMPAGEPDGQPGPAGESVPAETGPPPRSRAHVLATYAVELLAVLPALYMAWRVHRAPLMQYWDYWNAFYRITNPDGSPRWRGFLTYQNEHPFAVPSVIYYLAARFTDGNNRVLGYFVVVVAALSVLLLRSLLPDRWSPVTRAWLTVAMSFIVFCPAGLWNFTRGMSGTAWLTANLFAIAAILLANRRLTLLAVGAAGLSLLSYGTGFGAFVAVAAIALLRREAKWRWLLPLALLVAGGVIYLLTTPGGTSGGGVSRDLPLLASTFLSNLGLLWAPLDAQLSTICGAAGLVLFALAASVGWRRRDLDDLVPWFALGGYAIVAAGLVSLGRSEALEGDGVLSRYASLPALFWIAVMIVVLRVLLAGQPIVVGAILAAASVLVFYAAAPPLVVQARALDPAQNLLATAVRIDAADSFGPSFQRPDDVVPRLKALHDYPFSGRYSLGCGHLVPGDSIDVSEDRPLSPAAGRADFDRVTRDARRLRGWLVSRDKPVRCVLVVDPGGTIVGGGFHGFDRPDVVRTVPGAGSSVGWEAVAPAANSDATVVFGFDDGYRPLAAAP